VEGESVLDGLLRSGHDVAHGCKSGICQSCLVALDEGKVPTASQKGLTEAQASLGYLLSCQCHPEEEIRIKRINAEEQRVPAEIIHKAWLNDQVIQLRLKADIDFKAGQYVTLWKDSSLARSYSLACLPADGYLELHIKVLKDGQFSQWLAQDAQIGDVISLQGPLGQCFYTAASEQSMLLAAIGTGLAPVLGILKDALSKNHTGEIHLVIGAKERQSFYLQDELHLLAETHSNLQVHHVAQDSGDDIYQYCNALMPDMKGYKVYLCGAESFVKKLKKQCFLSGAGMSDIAADVFLPVS
jgi:NAD(P)H-flavin reductase